MTRMNQLQNMINSVIAECKSQQSVSLDHLCTVLVSGGQFGLVFEAIATLVQQGRLEKLASGSYRLKV